MASSGSKHRATGWLVALAGLAVTWSALWYGAASRLEAAAREQIARLETSGARAACENLGISGFPARLSLDCAAMAYARDIDGIAVTASHLSATWSVASPMTVELELASPGHAELPGLVPLDVDWTSLSMKGRLWFPRPSALSVDLAGLAARAGGDGAEVMSIASGTASARRSGEDLDFAVDIADAEVDPAFLYGHSLPPASALVVATVRQGARRLLGARPTLRDTTIDISRLVLEPAGKGSVSAAGSLAVDKAGHVEGELTVRMTDPGTLATMLTAAFPDQADAIRTGFDALAAMESPPGSGNGVTLRFTDSQAFLGFLPLGFLPALP